MAEGLRGYPQTWEAAFFSRQNNAKMITTK